MDSLVSRISVNCQSSIHITGEVNLWFDPFRVEGEYHDADMVFITHEHFDHFSPEDISKVSKEGTLFIAPESMKEKVEALCQNCVFLNPGDHTDLMGIHIWAVSAYNAAKDFHPKANSWLGYVVTIDEERVYVAGDMDACDQACEDFCDIAMVPIGGHYTQDVEQAAEFVKGIRPGLTIPVHYGAVVGKPEDGERFSRLISPMMCVLKLY